MTWDCRKHSAFASEDFSRTRSRAQQRQGLNERFCASDRLGKLPAICCPSGQCLKPLSLQAEARVTQGTVRKPGYLRGPGLKQVYSHQPGTALAAEGGLGGVEKRGLLLPFWGMKGSSGQGPLGVEGKSPDCD